MLEVVSWFVIALITHILDCYVFSKLIKEKYSFGLKILFIILLFSFVDYIIGYNYTGVLKSLVTNLITFLILKIVYDKTVSKTLIATLFIYLGYVLAEILFAVIFIIFLNIDSNFFVNGIGTIIVNLFVYVTYIMLFSIRFVKEIICNIMKWYDENKIFNLIFRIILILFLCYTIIYSVLFNNLNDNKEIFVLFLLTGIILFVYGYFNEKSGNNKLTIEYTQLLDYVKTYEEEVVDKSKKQHEYKNQLIIIDDMIPKTNKIAKEYLKNVLKNVEDVTDNDWLVKLKNLPSGGIKGLVHFKIKKMISNKISVYVDVDKNLSRKDNWVNVDKNLEDISRILGVYLDNAIEASTNAKDKQIIIEFINNDDSVEFILSNSYSGNINFNDLDKEGYSTKGKGRGVGLSLVKEIINNNKLLRQSRELNGKFYVQKLYIKK